MFPGLEMLHLAIPAKFTPRHIMEAGRYGKPPAQGQVQQGQQGPRTAAALREGAAKETTAFA